MVSRAAGEANGDDILPPGRILGFQMDMFLSVPPASTDRNPVSSWPATSAIARIEVRFIDSERSSSAPICRANPTGSSAGLVVSITDDFMAIGCFPRVMASTQSPVAKSQPEISSSPQLTRATGPRQVVGDGDEEAAPTAPRRGPSTIRIAEIGADAGFLHVATGSMNRVSQTER